MADVTYKLFFDDEPATREQLDLVEEITVEQQLDMAWEGRFQIPICTDENGKWSQEDEDFLRSFGRVRLEVKVGDRPFQPLIDGPIVGTDNQLSSLPGQSMMTLIVQDDSVYLNREQSSVPFENMLDHEVATELFGDVETISSTDIESTPPAPDGLTPTEMRRGTQMALLRRLARRQGMHAYVLPGDQPGASIGAFKKLPRDPGDLPTLVLLGPDRNVHTFNVTNDAQSPSRVEAHALSVTDKTTTTARVSTRDLELLGEEGSLTRESDAGARMLQPGQDGAVDPQQAANGEADRLAFSFEATGEVIGECYTAALTPYQVIKVKGANARLSGDFVIKRVTHRLTRSIYSQSFGLMRNARSAGSGGGLADLAGSIF